MVHDKWSTVMNYLLSNAYSSDLHAKYTVFPTWGKAVSIISRPTVTLVAKVKYATVIIARSGTMQQEAQTTSR